VSDETETEIDASRAPLLDHLIELRRRLLWSVVAIVITFCASLYFARPILGFLVAPLKIAGQTKIINTEIFGGFLVEVKVAFFAALMLSFPVIANQLACTARRSARCCRSCWRRPCCSSPVRRWPIISRCRWR
jgi:Sec-independent protein secretion pathway component TatC